MNRGQLDTLRERIEGLDSHEHAQLFEVLKRYTDKYTKTQTGVLVSSDNLPQECLRELDILVSFYADQRKRMESDTLERKALSRQTKTD
jgi:phage terminase Nu1 subunit (DNA packaging protein)